MSNIDKSLKRYKILDACLGDKSRQWTLEDLVARCSEIDSLQQVGLRTIQMDLHYLRTTYQAPIKVYGGKFYEYASDSYSIFHQSPAGREVEKLNNALEVLNNLTHFSLFSELQYDLRKLENRIQHYLTGTEVNFLSNLATQSPFLEQIMDHIRSKQSLQVSYDKSGQQVQILFCPYLLKEYEGHLYLCGWNLDRNKINVISVESIQNCSLAATVFYQDPSFDGDYFRDVIGIYRKMGDQPIVLHLWIYPEFAEQLTQYPIHHSQQVISVLPTGTKIALKVIWNDALETRILSYGSKLQVIAPKEFRKRILSTIKKTKKEYEKD